jgi:hypothetical protein
MKNRTHAIVNMVMAAFCLLLVAGIWIVNFTAEPDSSTSRIYGPQMVWTGPFIVIAFLNVIAARAKWNAEDDSEPNS